MEAVNYLAHVLLGYEIKSKSNVRCGSTFISKTAIYRSSDPFQRQERKVFFLFYPFYNQTINRRLLRNLLVG